MVKSVALVIEGERLLFRIMTNSRWPCDRGDWTMRAYC